MQEEDQTIPEMVDAVRAGKMSRRKLIKTLTIMGVSAAGAGAVAAAAARQLTAHSAPFAPGDNAQQHIQQHEQHLAHQLTGNVQQLQQDYHEDAIVEDSMYAHAFAGR